MQVLVSLITLGIAVWILAERQDADLQKFACGWIGLVVGYWLS